MSEIFAMAVRPDCRWQLGFVIRQGQNTVEWWCVYRWVARPVEKHGRGINATTSNWDSVLRVQNERHHSFDYCNAQSLFVVGTNRPSGCSNSPENGPPICPNTADFTYISTYVCVYVRTHVLYLYESCSFQIVKNHTSIRCTHLLVDFQPNSQGAAGDWLEKWNELIKQSAPCCVNNANNKTPSIGTARFMVIKFFRNQAINERRLGCSKQKPDSQWNFFSKNCKV